MEHVKDNKLAIPTDDASLEDVNSLLAKIEEILGYPLGRAESIEEECFVPYTSEELTFLELSGKMKIIDRAVDHYILMIAIRLAERDMQMAIREQTDRDIMNILRRSQSSSDSDIDDSNSSVLSGK